MLDLIQEISMVCEKKQIKIQNELKLSPIEFTALQQINEGENLTCNQFAMRLNLSFSRTSRVIDKLALSKLVKRVANKDDRRAIAVKLTAKGIETQLVLMGQVNKFEQSIVSILSKEELQEFEVLLKKIISTIDKEG